MPRQDVERQRLFRLIEELVKWENVNNEEVLGRARAEILKATDGNPPPLLDPFAGGGSIPLEAQRLGLEAHASDLNPVAVLINKALIEIPPKFAGRPPVHPAEPGRRTKRRPLTGQETWKGPKGWPRTCATTASGCATRPSGASATCTPRSGIRQQKAATATPRPKKSQSALEIENLTVIAWLWARTVKCPNPACGAQMPLVRSFALSTKPGKQAWVEPVVDRSQQPPVVRFEVRTGIGKPREGTVNRRGATCLCCGTPVPFDHVRSEGKAGRMSAQLMAIVAEGSHGRIYLPPNAEHEAIAAQAQPQNVPDSRLAGASAGLSSATVRHDQTPRSFHPPPTRRADHLQRPGGRGTRERVRRDAVDAGLPNDGVSLEEGGTGATAYADAVATYLAFAVDKMTDYQHYPMYLANQSAIGFERHLGGKHCR